MIAAVPCSQVLSLKKEVRINWEAIGAVGEILGATGVVATLLYLSIQTRNNTQATNAASAQAVSDKWIDVNVFITDHMGDLVAPIDHESDPLQAAKTVSAYRVIFHQYQSIHIQNKNGLLDKQYFEAICREIPTRLKTEVLKGESNNNWSLFWGEEKFNYTTDFRRFMDEMMDIR